jgi:hypothetical protein
MRSATSAVLDSPGFCRLSHLATCSPPYFGESASARPSSCLVSGRLRPQISPSRTRTSAMLSGVAGAGAFFWRLACANPFRDQYPLNCRVSSLCSPAQRPAAFSGQCGRRERHIGPFPGLRLGVEGDEAGFDVHRRALERGIVIDRIIPRLVALAVRAHPHLIGPPLLILRDCLLNGEPVEIGFVINVQPREVAKAGPPTSAPPSGAGMRRRACITLFAWSTPMMNTSVFLATFRVAFFGQIGLFGPAMPLMANTRRLKRGRVKS